MSALLALEDGRVFRGVPFGARGTTTGEVCFNTSMTGYQEILTDPSYRGQIVAMTYPLIGNYGTNLVDGESGAAQVRGFVIEELSPVVSSWRSQESLEDFLTRQAVPGIQSVDTRALTRHLRLRGALRACLSTEPLTDDAAVERARSATYEGVDFVKEVSTSSPYEWDAAGAESAVWVQARANLPAASQRDAVGNVFAPLPPVRAKIVAYDFGTKKNILRSLRRSGFAVDVVPADTPASDVLARNPDGIFLSNGPGDPATLDYAHRAVRELVGKKPIFGICLGHQILALALGGRTFKLKFGHRGANHPVKDLRTGKIAITSQNHGYAVDPDSLPKDVEVTHVNLNDGTVAGLRMTGHPVSSVQYHPEACPGPQEAAAFFQDFAKEVLT